LKGVESPKKCEPVPSWFIVGRIENGLDFLGYHFSPEGLSVAEKTIEKFLARAVWLYDQEKGSLSTPLNLHWLRLKKIQASLFP